MYVIVFFLFFDLSIPLRVNADVLVGGGFPAFGQAKPVVTPFGQTMAGPMVSSNPFLVSKRVAICGWVNAGHDHSG